jgi:hypothetical protein
VKIIQCDQYSPEWWTARRGVPTASEFHKLLTAKTMKLSASADGYAAQLIGDVFDPLYPRVDRAVSEAMRVGTEREPEARSYYALERGVDVQQVGFCLDDTGRFGCSPDGLIMPSLPDVSCGPGHVSGEPMPAGCLELKNPEPKTQVEYLLDTAYCPMCKGRSKALALVDPGPCPQCQTPHGGIGKLPVLPSEYRAQCHGHLIVTGAAWVDFLSYCPGLPPLLVRVVPNEFTDALRDALDAFYPRFQAALEKIRNA